MRAGGVKMKRFLMQCFIFFIGNLLVVNVQAATWKTAAPGGGGWYSSVAIGPDGLIVVGSDLSGAYLSNNSGFTWEQLGASKGLTETHISAIGLHPQNANIIFIGTERGIFRSADKGKTFSRVLNLPAYVTAIQFAPSNPNIWYAALHTAYNQTNASVYVSQNNGLTWAKQSGPFAKVRIQKLVVHPQKSTEIFAVSGADRFVKNGLDPVKKIEIENNTYRRVFHSINSGKNWYTYAAPQGLAFDIAFNLMNSNEVFLSTENGVFLSSNQGSTWKNTGIKQEKDYLGYIVGYSLWPNKSVTNPIRAISNALTIWGFESGIYSATRSGSQFTWNNVISSVDAHYAKANWETPDYWHFSERGMNDLRGNFYHTSSDLRGFAIDPRNTNRMIFVNDQWAFETTTGGTRFNNLFTNRLSNGWTSRGLNNVNVYEVEASGWTSNNVLFAGYADLGCWRSINNGVSWESCQAIGKGWAGDRGGNMTTIVTDPTITGVTWAAMGAEPNASMSLMKSSQSGKFDSWSDVTQGIPSTDRKLIYGLSIDRTSSANRRVLFVTANGNVYRSQNGGSSWSKVLDCRAKTQQQNNVAAYCISTAVDAFNGKLVYAAGSAGIFTSYDGGSTWSWTDTNRMRTAVDLDSLFAPHGNRYFVSKIATDPRIANKVYVSIFDQNTVGNRGGIWVGTKGTAWQKIYSNPYMRDVEASPQVSGELLAISSRTYVDGGYTSDSKGVLRFNPSTKKWQTENGGLVYPNASSVSYTATVGRQIIGSMGQGLMRNW